MQIYEPYGIVKTDGTVVAGKLDELKEANRIILPEELAERVNRYRDAIKQIDMVEELERKRKMNYEKY